MNTQSQTESTSTLEGTMAERAQATMGKPGVDPYMMLSILVLTAGPNVSHMNTFTAGDVTLNDAISIGFPDGTTLVVAQVKNDAETGTSILCAIACHTEGIESCPGGCGTVTIQ